MPEIEEEVSFNIEPKNISFMTSASGDKIIIKGINFDEEMAATMAWLSNQVSPVELKVEITIAP